MIPKRAKEIINSEDPIEVLYKGNSVWLENINEDSKMANVRILENNEKVSVPVSELIETGRELK